MEAAVLQVFRDLDVWQILAVFVKGATYGASFAAAGAAIFIVVFSDLISAQEERALRPFVIHSAWIAMLLSVLRIVVMNGMLSGELSGIMDVALTRLVLESSEGSATGLRLASLMTLALLCQRPLSGATRWAALSAALVAATSFAWVGHVGEVPMPPGTGLLTRALLCLHLLAVCFWLGALWPLLKLTQGDDSARIAAIVQRFGHYATAAIGLLVAAGTMLLGLLLVQLDLLWTSAYGQLFMAKIILAVALLTIAAINKFWLTPQLISGVQSAIVALRCTITAEIVLAGLILLAAASFTTLVGPAD